MKLLIASMLTFLSTAAFAQVTTFNCPRVFEMVDYNPDKQAPIFSELKNSRVYLSETSKLVRLGGQTWTRVGVTPLPADEVKPAVLIVEYVALLFGTRLKPEEIVETVSQVFFRSDLKPEEQDQVQAILVKTATTTYRYLQFSHSDLAICKD